MDEELEKEESVSIQTETVSSVGEETKQTLDSLPSIEQLKKSEQEVKVNAQIEGVTNLEPQTKAQDRVFKLKKDERKVYFKKRLKIVTAVYSTVVALLLGFVITNVATLAMLDKDISANTKTIQSQQQQVEVLKENPAGESLGDFQISINEPRDYSEDKKELTWLDKVTILFRNLFS